MVAVSVVSFICPSMDFHQVDYFASRSRTQTAEALELYLRQYLHRNMTFCCSLVAVGALPPTGQIVCMASWRTHRQLPTVSAMQVLTPTRLYALYICRPRPINPLLIGAKVKTFRKAMKTNPNFSRNYDSNNRVSNRSNDMP